MKKLLLLLVSVLALTGGQYIVVRAQAPPLFATNAKYIGYGGTGGGTANVQTVTYSPALSAYADGQIISWLPSNANSSGATLNVNGLGAHSIVKFGGVALVANDLKTTAKAVVIYNSTGTVFELQNPQTTPTGAVTSITGDGTIITNSGSTGAVTLTVATQTGTGSIVLANTPTLITPVIGAATGTSLLATGLVDGQAPVIVTTGTTGTPGATYNHSYSFNEEATAGTGVNYTLPTAAPGKQYCIANAYYGSNPNTGVLTITTSASGQFIIFTDGTLSASGGNVTSGGAAADGACVVGVDSTHWFLYVQSGTWTKH